MFRIVNKKQINEKTTLIDVEAPLIAKKALPGQFIIFRIDELGERVPLTIADTDAEKGTVTIVFESVGTSTTLLASLNVNDKIQDFVGPLGIPTHIDESVKKVCVIGGGTACAIAYPQAKYLFNLGAQVDIIAGFRNKDFVILEEEMKACSTNYYPMTNDGSYGEEGLVTEKFKSLVNSGNNYDLVICIGPVVMMKFVSQLTKEYNVKTIVSLNPIMIDGTGMCGGCRVTVGGKAKFACVDGPDFDGHEVNFDELILRNTFYKEAETHSRENCRLIRRDS